MRISIVIDESDTTTVFNRNCFFFLQIPFKKSGGVVQSVKFHPTKHFLFVAVSIAIFDMMIMVMSKGYNNNCIEIVYNSTLSSE